jgi:uncharacterized membrane protein YccC
VGAGFGFALVHLADAPWLQLVLLAGWISINGGLTHILRGMHGYGALLSGMTAAVVVLPTLFFAQDATDTAQARVICTLIGVAVVTLVTGFFTPASPRQELYDRVRRLSRDALRFAAAAIDGLAGADAAAERRLVAAMSEAGESASLITAGSVDGYRRLRQVQGVLVAALATMAAAQAACQRRRRGEARLPDGSGARLLQLAGAPALPTAPGEFLPGLRSEDPRLVQALERQAGAEALLTGDPSADARSFRRKLVYLAPHREWPVAIMTGIVPGLCVLLGGLAGWWSGWPMAELAVLGLCIFSMVLGAMPLPQLIAPRMLKGVLGGVAMAILYRLAVQPFVASPLELTLSMAPFMALGGLVRASRRTAIPGIDFNMCFLLASQAVLPTPAAPFGTILEEAAALVLSALVVTTGFRLLPRRPDRQAMAVAEAIRSDLAMLVAGQRPSAPPGSIGPARILRLMLHLGRAASLGARAPCGLLAVLNLGHAIVGLHRQQARPDLDRATRRTLDEALAALRDLAVAPDEVAVLLEQHAAHVPEPQARSALLGTAGALRDGKELLRFGLAGR